MPSWGAMDCQRGSATWSYWVCILHTGLQCHTTQTHKDFVKQKSEWKKKTHTHTHLWISITWIRTEFSLHTAVFQVMTLWTLQIWWRRLDSPTNTGNCLPYYMVLQPHALQYESSVPQISLHSFLKFPILKDKTCQHSCDSAKLHLHNPSSWDHII